MKHLKTFKVFESQLTNMKLEKLKELSREVKSFLMVLGTDLETQKRSGLEKELHAYLTTDYDAFNQVSSENLKPEERKKYTVFWENLKIALEEKAKKMNWETSNNPGWFQVKKKSNITSSGNNDKSYITFKKDDKFFDEYKKLGKLLEELDKLANINRISFKIPNSFTAAWSSYESIVIHFTGNSESTKEVKKIIDNIYPNRLDRKSIGRVEFGKDNEKQSDSEIVSDKIINNFITNKDTLLKYLDQNDETEFRKGISAIKDIIEKVSMNSSHRN